MVKLAALMLTIFCLMMFGIHYFKSKETHELIFWAFMCLLNYQTYSNLKSKQ